MTEQRIQRHEAGRSKWAHLASTDTSDVKTKPSYLDAYPYNKGHENGWVKPGMKPGMPVKKWCSDADGKPVPCVD